ncbi:MAG: glutamate racemase [Beijerinckiaceae bacterium]
MAPTILVFDSGLGGLTVHAEVRNLLPDARYAYVADDAAFPYGRLAAEACATRVVEVVGHAIRRFAPDIAVIACNTASTVALPALRAAFATPFVGTVPAVKPAAALSASKMISILGTPGTVSREYTHDLIIQHAADCRVQLVGAPRLAELAEAHLRGDPVADRDVLSEIAPCFREKDGRRTDTVALACTHYPLLLDVYRRVAPWEVAWIDPAPAIARRVQSLLGTPQFIQRFSNLPDSIRDAGESTENTAFLTSGAPISGTLARVFAARALASGVGFRVPFDSSSV